MTRTSIVILAGALSIAGLTGCSGSESDPAPVANAREDAAPSSIEDSTPVPTATETTRPSPAPTAEMPVAINAVDAAPLEEAPAPDEQMMDDAAATGMTARVTRDTPDAADGTPGELVERK